MKVEASIDHRRARSNGKNVFLAMGVSCASNRRAGLLQGTRGAGRSASSEHVDGRLRLVAVRATDPGRAQLF